MSRGARNTWWVAALALVAYGASVESAPLRRFASASDCHAKGKKQRWGTYLKPIPSTVIDVGVLKHVPYKSYRAGDYEINIYGDPDDPAGVEIGVYGSLINAQQAKKSCLVYMEQILFNPADRDILHTLNLAQDLKESDGVTLEITPPTAEDAYGGWWVSAYNEEALDAARASDDELAEITEYKATPKTTARGEAPAWMKAMEGRSYSSSWTSSEMSSAKPGKPSSSSSSVVYVKGYYRKDGTYVRPHTRSKPRRK